LPVHINHAIVAADDRTESARCFAELFGLAEPEAAGPFAVPQRGINHNHGGRGVAFLDPAGNYLEALTRPYAEA